MEKLPLHMQKFISWLESDLTNFVSIVEEGSVVSGDPWQEGFSDHDLNIIVSKDVQTESAAIYNFLNKTHLGNEYLVGVRLLGDFIKGDSLNDISLKFRTKSLAGKDVVDLKQLPSQTVAYKIGKDGLTGLVKRFERRWLNLAHWTIDYAQHKNYEIFKNFFVFFSALHYGKTGIYPVSRAEAAEILNACGKSIALLLQTTNSIAQASKEQQKETIEMALLLIDDVLSSY